MNKIFILLFMSILLYASTPKIYAALGNNIYNNVQKIATLKSLEEYAPYENEIKNYVKEVARVKKMGLAAEISNNSAKMKTYLEELRKLSKQNDFFIRSVQTNYDKALRYQQNELFIGVINSGLMDISAKKQEIMDYYYENELTLTPSGHLEELVHEDTILKQRRNSSHARYKTKKMIEDEKIKRIRENDLQSQKELEAKLQEEVNKKKLKIRETQKEALSL